MNLPLILLGALFIFDTVFIMYRSNINMGVVMPALIGIPILFYGLFFNELHLWFSLGIGRYVGAFILLCYAAFLLLIAVCSFLIVRALKKPAAADADVVIVLGAAVHGSKLSRALQNRLDLAMEYIEESPGSLVVVSGGQGRQEQISEARAMKQYLLSHNVPPEKIITEERSSSTYENFKFSGEILKGIFSKKYSAVFVTNDFHVFRAGIAAKAAGIKADGIGCPSPFYIVPNYYMRESLAILRYALMGPR